jgi:transcription initiation factor IIE alpha subunit
MALDNKVEHRWIRHENTESWLVYCEIDHDFFSPRIEAFEENGRCPLCGASAKSEMDMRKRIKEEKERQYKMNAELRAKNTLGGWL